MNLGVLQQAGTPEERGIVHLRVDETPVVAKLAVEQRLATGETREFAVPRDKIYLFDAEGEERVGS